MTRRFHIDEEKYNKMNGAGRAKSNNPDVEEEKRPTAEAVRDLQWQVSKVHLAVDDQKKAFDRFTIRALGIQFNGVETVIDESGGLIGRMATRMTITEDQVKMLREAYNKKLIPALLFTTLLALSVNGFIKFEQVFTAIKTMWGH